MADVLLTTSMDGESSGAARVSRIITFPAIAIPGVSQWTGRVNRVVSLGLIGMPGIGYVIAETLPFAETLTVDKIETIYGEAEDKWSEEREECSQVNRDPVLRTERSITPEINRVEIPKI